MPVSRRFAPYYPIFSQIAPYLDKLKDCVKDHNNQVHRLKRASRIDDKDEVVLCLKKVFKQPISVPFEYLPFNRLNQGILGILSI